MKVNPAQVIPLMEISRTPGKTEKKGDTLQKLFSRPAPHHGSSSVSPETCPFLPPRRITTGARPDSRHSRSCSQRIPSGTCGHGCSSRRCRDSSPHRPTEPPETPVHFSGWEKPSIPEKPAEIKPQRILDITSKKSNTRGIIPMTNPPTRSAQPSDKPTYTPPRVMRLGDLNEGAGACETGSGVTTGDCNPGTNATGVCSPTGSTSDDRCSTGNTATGGFGCGPGSIATGSCMTGANASAGPCSPAGSGNT
jgi:hypothetical protein